MTVDLNEDTSSSEEIEEAPKEGVRGSLATAPENRV